ncbi:MAG: DUF3857 domain-containing protein, partial [Bacteroidota bacterium]
NRMNHHLLLFFLVALLPSAAFAQLTDKRNFGEISNEEIAIEQCAFDSSADAIVLFDVGASEFLRTEQGFEIRFTRHKRIKILNEAGRSAAEITILYRKQDKEVGEKINELRAYTYNIVNGSIQRKVVNPKSVFDEKWNKYFRAKKFVFPDVQVESIVEYSYELTSPFIFYLSDWDFQSDLPTYYSEFEVSMVPFYEYVHLVQGVDSLDIMESKLESRMYYDFGVDYKRYTTTFGLREIEAFKDESLITSKNDYIKKVDFQLSKILYPDGRTENRITTWAEQRKELLDDINFGRFLKKCNPFAKTILKEDLDTTGRSMDEKVELLVNYVKNGFQWNRYRGKYSSQSPKELLKKKTGSAADINLFLVALLRAADIPCDPMILSTRDNGKVKFAYPFGRATNYVVAYAPNHGILDGTQPLLAYNLVPPSCINELGLLVNKSKEDQWFSVEYSFPSIEKKLINMKVDPSSLTTSVKIEEKSTSFKAFKKRQILGDDIQKIEESLVQKFDRVDSIYVETESGKSNQYRLAYKAETDIEQLGDYLVLSPFLNFPMNKNPLKLEKRSYPVDFIYPYRNEHYVNLEIPDGYEATKIPESVNVDNGLVLIQYKCLNSGSSLFISGTYELKSAVYQPEDYQLLKKNMDDIVEVMNQKIYLVPKG